MIFKNEGYFKDTLANAFGDHLSTLIKNKASFGWGDDGRHDCTVHDHRTADCIYKIDKSLRSSVICTKITFVTTARLRLSASTPLYLIGFEFN